MYPGSLADIPALRAHLANPGADFPGARAIASRLLTLPVYPTLTEPEVRRIAAAFRGATGRRAA
jgi:dTDP-4-amino-4,6-dideoxygalactose transaminase